MNNNILKNQKKYNRRKKIRAKIFGTSQRPRLNVFKSNTSIYVQVIDDTKGITLVSAHSKEIKIKDKKISVAFELGKLIAKKILEKNINQVAFDRSGNKYHGRIKAVAEGARSAGLKF